MELIKLNVNARCDMALCKNLAHYSIVTGVKSPWRKESGGIYVCQKCLNELYSLIGKEVVPKSPANMIKMAQKRRESNEK